MDKTHTAIAALLADSRTTVTLCTYEDVTVTETKDGFFGAADSVTEMALPAGEYLAMSYSEGATISLHSLSDRGIKAKIDRAQWERLVDAYAVRMAREAAIVEQVAAE